MALGQEGLGFSGIPFLPAEFVTLAAVGWARPKRGCKRACSGQASAFMQAEASG
jgi:hypothetical protein